MKKEIYNRGMGTRTQERLNMVEIMVWFALFLAMGIAAFMQVISLISNLFLKIFSINNKVTGTP